MALWVRVSLALACVGCVAAAVDHSGSWLRSRPRSHSGWGTRPSRYPSRPWRAHRLSVPETPQPSDTDQMEQLQQLLHQIVNGTQSDQPRQPSHLASRVGPRMGSRRPSSAITFNNFSIMNDAIPEFDAGATTEVIALVTLVSVNYSCREPVRQLVPVSEVHRAVSVTYLPVSVPLRRCSGHTGSCSDSETCGPAANTTTQLPIMVNHVVGIRRSELKYLNFVEHTECKCIPKTRTPRRTPEECPQSSPASGERSAVKLRAGKKQNKQKGGKRDKKSAQQTCNCTSEFASRLLPNGRCKCDCFVSNRKCKRQQRGRFLSEADNRCIRRGDCKPPVCRHGKYRASYGRCPQRKGEFRKRRFIV